MTSELSSADAPLDRVNQWVKHLRNGGVELFANFVEVRVGNDGGPAGRLPQYELAVVLGHASVFEAGGSQVPEILDRGRSGASRAAERSLPNSVAMWS